MLANHDLRNECNGHHARCVSLRFHHRSAFEIRYARDRAHLSAILEKSAKFCGSQGKIARVRRALELLERSVTFAGTRSWGSPRAARDVLYE